MGRIIGEAARTRGVRLDRGVLPDPRCCNRAARAGGTPCRRPGATDGPDAPRLAPVARPVDRRGRSACVLVDDHRLILESLARVLDAGARHPRRRHRDVGRGGRARPPKEPVDVVLMDYRLSRRDRRRGHPRHQGPLAVEPGRDADRDRRRRDGPRVDPGRRRRLPHQGPRDRGRRRHRAGRERRGDAAPALGDRRDRPPRRRGPRPPGRARRPSSP